MKKFWTRVLWSGLVVMAPVIPAAAQLKLNFQAPGTFYAGNAKLPEGAYSISQMGAGNGDVCVITSSSGAHSVLLDCRHSSKTASGGGPEVLFNRYRNVDYLEAAVTNAGISVDFDQSTAEKIAAKNGTAQPHSAKAK